MQCAIADLSVTGTLYQSRSQLVWFSLDTVAAAVPHRPPADHLKPQRLRVPVLIARSKARRFDAYWLRTQWYCTLADTLFV